MNEIVRRQVSLLLQQVQLLAALLDADLGPPGDEALAEGGACPRCEGPLREVVIDGQAGLICAECNTPASAEGV